MKIKLVMCLYSIGERYYALERRCYSMRKGNFFNRKRAYSLQKRGLISDQGGFGMNELLGIAAALIIAAFVIIPGLKTFTDSLMNGLKDWWTNTIAAKIFPTT